MSDIYAPSQTENAVPSIKLSVFIPFLLLFIIAGSVFLALRLTNPPHSIPASAPAAEFSSGRALKHVELIAAKPHPIGSLSHREVRDYLLQQLSTMGLNPEVQQTAVVNRRRSSSINAATVENVVARLKGSGGGKALLLAGHYDSVPTGPGASDNAAGVATLLETARALKAHPPLQNDVIFLFTDAEEVGLLGARAFVNQHPWAKDVGLVLNFEARGNSGPSIMFETSANNQWLIKGFGQAVPYPVANSLTYEIYKLLPNDTDLSVFREANFAGLNFAYINGFTHYHSSLDTPGELNERSLQHHGSYALSLTRFFGNQNLAGEKGPDAIYFDLFGLVLVRYPAQLAIALAVLSLLLLVAVIYLGFRRGHLKLTGILFGYGVILMSLIVTPLIIMLIWWLVGGLQSARGLNTQALSYHQNLYLLSFVILTLAINATLYLWLQRKLSLANLAVGAAIWWALLTVLSSLLLPGASYLFIWPLLFYLIGLGYLMLDRDWQAKPVNSSVVMSLVALPALVMWSPVIFLIFAAMGFDAVIAVVVMVTLMTALLILPLRSIAMSHIWLAPGAAALAGLVLLAIGIFVTGYDSAHPKSDHLFYALNATSGKAVWASSDEKPDEWTGQFLTGEARRQELSEFIPWRRDSFLHNSAPVMPLASPDATLLDDSTSDGLRTLKLRVKSLRQAPLMTIVMDADTAVHTATINGQQVSSDDPSVGQNDRQRWRLNYYAVPAEGIDLMLQVKAATPVKLLVMDQSYGLPEIPGAAYKPRPSHLIPSSWNSLSDLTLVNKSFTF